MTLGLIIEASLESYFQFWLQSNYSLPDIFSNIETIGELVTWRTMSIVFSFITITFSIYKIRFEFLNISIEIKVFFSNKDKNEALAPTNIIVLVVKVLMDLVSRVLIFFAFMIVHDDGKFSPTRTLTSFYTMVALMIIFNIVFNERRNFKSLKFWLGKFLFGVVNFFAVNTQLFFSRDSYQLIQ